MTPAAWEIIVGDNRESLRALPEKHYHLSMTSPPYWKQRDYQVNGQLGMEADPEDYLRNLVDVFREVKRVLRDDGVLVVNMGDTYSSDGKHGGKTSGKHRRQLHDNTTTRTARPVGIPAGNLMNMPHRFAQAMQADGWVWRSTIIWHKRAPMPESLKGWRWSRCRVKVKKGQTADETHPDSYKANTPGENGKRNRHCVGGEWVGGPEWAPCPGCKKCKDTDGWVLTRGKWRPTNSHEYLFFFTKEGSKEYFCDGDGSQEKASTNTHPRGKGMNPKAAATAAGDHGWDVPKANDHYSAAMKDVTETRNMRGVWSITNESFKGKHFATYPSELVRRVIVCTTSPAGCCSVCGSQYAPAIEEERIATRPGANTKVGRASDDDDSPYHQHNGTAVGNRDPQRHTKVTKILGYRPSCSCSDHGTVPARVLDPFVGSGTTLQVCSAYGRESTGLELSANYAETAKTQRLNKPPLCLIREQKAARLEARKKKAVAKMKTIDPKLARFIQKLLFEVHYGE